MQANTAGKFHKAGGMCGFGLIGSLNSSANDYFSSPSYNKGGWELEEERPLEEEAKTARWHPCLAKSCPVPYMYVCPCVGAKFATG